MHTKDEVDEILEGCRNHGEHIDTLLQRTSQQREDIAKLREELNKLEEDADESG